MIKPFCQLLFTFVALSCMLVACYAPPYNHFEHNNTIVKDTATGATIGTVVGLVADTTPVGLGIGAGVGLGVGLFKDTKEGLIRALNDHDIQYVQNNHTATLIVPTDRYFYLNKPDINDTEYDGLKLIIRLVSRYPNSPVFVAGFTDNINTTHYQHQLSTARANAITGLLYAYHIPAKQLTAKGYGKYVDIGSNQLVHGRAYNRRIEIQWSLTQAR
jgi:outer membrane protein OmpA-like peptidoglycan-associated protein